MTRVEKRQRPELRVAWADSKAAHFACTRWHYSASVPPGVSNIVGVWEDDAFIGVVMFARGASPHLAKQFGVSQTESCELVRVALRAHSTPVSRIVRIAVKLVRTHNPGLRLIISFADPARGHHGGIYQAGGWTYVGRSAPSHAYVDRTGRVWHQRQVTATGYGIEFGQRRRCVKKSEVRAVTLPGKHRYLLPLDARMRALCIELARPYPKRDDGALDVRAGSADSGTGGTPAAKGQCESDPGAPITQG